MTNERSTAFRSASLLSNPTALLSMSSSLWFVNFPCFNAGIGSVVASNGRLEMDACIMDGNTKACGAVSGLTTVVNPISLARLIMEKTPHVYLAFDGTEAFAREQVTHGILSSDPSFVLESLIDVILHPGVETADPSHYITLENIERLSQVKEANRVQTRSTKCQFRRGTRSEQLVGDTPIIGAGTYANKICAVSATGVGEAIIRATMARDVAALMEYKGSSLEELLLHMLYTNVFQRTLQAW